MRVVTTIEQHSLARAAASARQAEARGFSGITTLENRHDPFLPLAVAATGTSRLELSTGIALAFVRSPMSTAHIAWDLNVASAGRFVLGLGTQIRAHNEKRYSVPWGPPAPRMREYVTSLRAIWQAWQTGERLRYEGEHYRFTLMPPNFVPEPTTLAPPPVTIAAVGPAMLSLAGEVADGVRLHPLCTRAYMAQHVLPRIDEGLALSGRERANFEINGGGFLATGPTDEAVAEKIEWVRQRIGFYGSTPAYRPVLEAEAHAELGDKLNHMTKQGQWDRLAAEVPDDLVHACAAVGRHDEIAAVVEQRFGGLSDTLLASASYEHPSDLPPDVIEDITRIATPFRGFARPAAGAGRGSD
ncbi:MAG: TIGR03617 family F420-dependent LLM class oxidoreductase [Gammaproteobacteria bacterium]